MKGGDAMAGKKAKNEISDNALVQKARPFFNLWQYGFKLFDYKVFDLYLGIIDSHKLDSKLVTFTKADFSKILDVDKTLTAQELDKRFETLISKVISIDTKSKYPIRTTLFASAYVDTTIEPFNVQLEVSEQLLQLVFNIDKENGHGYFKYRLRNTLQLKSVYSYLMFNLLQSKANRTDGNILGTTFTADIEYLKNMLNCEDDETYKSFFRFNDLILKKCHKEITSKTELQYSYKTIKQGRFVKAIEFTISPFTFAEVPKVLQDAGAGEEPKAIEPQQHDTDLKELTETEKTSLYYLIKVKYPDFTEEQTNNKLKALYYYCLPKVKNKSKLADFMNVVLLNEQQQKTITNDDDFDIEKYKIFINNF